MAVLELIELYTLVERIEKTVYISTSLYLNKNGKTKTMQNKRKPLELKWVINKSKN